MAALALTPARIWLSVRRWWRATKAQLWVYTKKTCVWFVPMLITAGLTAWLSYFYNQKSNTELAVQQQTFSDLQAFRNSGADLDQALGSLSDALVDGKGVDEARARMRSAITRHISDALANEKALGPSSSNYVKGLARLRKTVDAVNRDAVETGSLLWEQSLSLMSERRRLIAAAQLTATDQ